MPSRSRGAPRLTTTQQGLGYNHQTNRDRLLKRHVNGTHCWWCGKPMYREAHKNWDKQPLSADHTKARSRHRKTAADRLLHSICNSQRGDGTHDDQRPALLTQPQPTTHTNDLGPLAIPWPWHTTPT